MTDDGAETDLDLGHYERFLNHSTSQANNVLLVEFIKPLFKKKEKGTTLEKQFRLFRILLMK